MAAAIARDEGHSLIVWSPISSRKRTASSCRPVSGSHQAGDSAQSTTPAIELHRDQLGEFGRDVCHRIFCSTEAGSRAEQGADLAESFVRRLVHDGDEQ